MKYSEVIDFTAIQTVVQLRHADRIRDAQRLVETFVLSDRISDQLKNVFFPHLGLDTDGENKGIFIVGNHGTGKSHLMAVLSALAEHRGLTRSLTNRDVADRAAPIAGRFKVVRAETNASMPLRAFIMGSLQDRLAEWGVRFQLPAEDQVRNHKDALGSMMDAFMARFPEHGLLFVLDELLDYLRGNEKPELVRNLNFLRALGEFTAGTRFRFIAGVQESLFDGAISAENLPRIRDRFEQVQIARGDIAHVVAERLLRKDEKQRARIGAHLRRFGPLYGDLNERLDEYVRLFPVHPAYLQTFEKIRVAAEKRELLKTLSAAIDRILASDIPSEAPGLIAYDGYWQNLKEDPSLRAVPEIRLVIETADILEARIRQGFTKPHYRSTALRIVHALAVHRLTTDDIYVPQGPTAEELRDELCLFLPVPEREAGFLKTTVETVLREIFATVSGQFISVNPANGQYYLDLKKDIDFDAQLRNRAAALNDADLDRYYFEGLRRLVFKDADCPPCVPGYRMWMHELVWPERRAGRKGHVFFGAQNERPTAQPRQFFFISFLQPYEAPSFPDEQRPDEVCFRLSERGDVFDRALRLYAAACELSAAASGSTKAIYQGKATEHLGELSRWLFERKVFAVTHFPPGDSGLITLRDWEATAAKRLSAHFEDTAPNYPEFGVPITDANRTAAAQDAFRWITGGSKTKLGRVVLEALEMADGDPQNSRYARQVLEKVAGNDRVVDRSEFVETFGGQEYWTFSRIEPELLGVVLAGLVQSGELVLRVGRQKIEASSGDRLKKLSVAEVARFKHIQRPRGPATASVRALFELLDLPEALVRASNEAVGRLQAKVTELLKRLVLAEASLDDLKLWGEPVLLEAKRREWRENLKALKSFLEGLQGFDTADTLKSLPYGVTAIEIQRPNVLLVEEIEAIARRIGEVEPAAAYLTLAEAVLPRNHPWAERMNERRAELIAQLTHSPSSLERELADLKSAYIFGYLQSHREARLDAESGRRKAQLEQDPRLDELQQLSEIFPGEDLRAFKKAISGLRTCVRLTESDLEATPICPHCRFRPIEEPDDASGAEARLAELESGLEEMVARWRDILVETLGSTSGVDALDGRRQLPLPMSPGTIQSLRKALVLVSEAEVVAALTEQGRLSTVTGLRQRFEGLLERLSEGQEGSKVRVLLTKTQKDRK